MHDRVAVEGNKTVFPCYASSKPASIFTWYREGQRDVIYQGNGTLNSNQLAYEIDRVNRNDAGTYKCIANNGIETADEKLISLIVHCKYNFQTGVMNGAFISDPNVFIKSTVCWFTRVMMDIE